MTLRRPWLSLGLSVLVAAVLIPCGQLANRYVFDAAPSRVEDSLLLLDLAGIARYADDPSVLGPDSRITRRDVAVCYSPVMWDSLAPWGRCPWFPKAGARLLDQPEIIAGKLPPPSDFKALWLAAIVRHPLAYAEHRVRHMNAELFLLVSNKPRNGIIPVEARYLDVEVREPVLRTVAKHTAGVVFIPAVMTVLAMVAALLLFLRSRRPNGPALHWAALAMSLSALLYAVSYAVVGVAAAPRYYFLTAVLASLALTVALGDPVVRAMLRDRRRLRLLCIALPLLAIGVAQIGRIFVPVPPAMPLMPAS